MSEKKISFRDEFTQNNLHKKEERAKKDFNRNVLGLDISALVFLGMLLMTLRGVRFGGNLSMLVVVSSMVGVFYFGRELRVLPKGQIHFSVTNAILCIVMMGAYVLMHQGYWDWMDYGILGILTGVILIDIPRVMKAMKEMKS